MVERAGGCGTAFEYGAGAAASFAGGIRTTGAAEERPWIWARWRRIWWISSRFRPKLAGDADPRRAGPVLCEADRTQVERVITNLLSNAMKYTPTGGWVRPGGDDGSERALMVEDSGVGIPRNHLPHIFDRFYRVPDPNPEKGLGLGLSFVAAIVKAHGGEIRVESDSAKGHASK